MTPLEIKIEMLRSGITQPSIAKKLGVSTVYVHQVIRGLRRSQTIRQTIAEAVGKSVEELWPEESPNKAA